jgi:mono/diheme cytochrome c family protein
MAKESSRSMMQMRIVGLDIPHASPIRFLRALLLQSALVALILSGCAREQGTHPSGEVLYHRYCASCHGVAGKGDGPLAASLRKPPTDLTTLARRAGGRFDEAYVMAVIDGKRLVAEHGPREMPVWGVIFDEELKDQPYTQYTGLLRSQVLADYLRSIQQE